MVATTTAEAFLTNVTKSTTASPSPAEISYDSFCNQSEFDETFSSSPPKGNKVLKNAGSAPLEISSSRPRDRRLSKEWDAAKVVPSRFQKREGSIYATPGSRGQIDKDRDKGYHEKLKAMLGKVQSTNLSIRLFQLM
ncbi:hypothetical protein MMC29_001641 [Sticta canariensis]|nr:hypothetical protein [Sticta canariensis]